MLSSVPISVSISDSKEDFEKQKETDHFFNIPRVNNPIIEENLPKWLDGLDQLAEYVSVGPTDQFIPPVSQFSPPEFFTDEPPEYFESMASKEMKYWNKAMYSGLGGGMTLDERCLLEIRGVPVSQSSLSEIRKVNRILGYPATQRWIEQHETVYDEIVMRESLLSNAQYRMAVFSLPFIRRDDTVDLLLAFFQSRGDLRAAEWVGSLAQSIRDNIAGVSHKRGAKRTDPVLKVFKSLYPASFKLFSRTVPQASEMMQAFQIFCADAQTQTDRRKWALMISQVRCLLRTLFSRGCEPLEITKLTHTLLAQAPYVTLHMTGNTDKVIFQDGMHALHNLDGALEMHINEDPAFYSLEENNDLIYVSERPSPDSGIVFRKE